MYKLYNSTDITYDTLLLTDVKKGVHNYDLHNLALENLKNGNPGALHKNITQSLTKLSEGTTKNTFHYYNHTGNSSIPFLISIHPLQQGYTLVFQELPGHSTPAAQPLGKGIYPQEAMLNRNLNFFRQVHETKDRFTRWALSQAQNLDEIEVLAGECGAFAAETRLPVLQNVAGCLGSAAATRWTSCLSCRRNYPNFSTSLLPIHDRFK